METPKKLFDERLSNLLMTVDHKEPKHVPIGLDLVSWPTAYAGVRTDELVDYPEKMAENYVKVFNDIYCDCLLEPGVTYPIRSLQALGGNSYIISSDGVTIQHIMQDCIMKEDEYDQLIADPNDFTLNVLTKRKYEKFNVPEKEAYEAAKKAAVAMKSHIYMNQLIEDKIDNEFGLIRLWGKFSPYHPFDFLFDGLRGMKGTLVDIRRHPQKVVAALEALYENTIANSLPNFDDFKGKAWPFAKTGFHGVPYIGMKDFERLWWDFFVKMFQPYIDAGVKVFLKAEGQAGYCFDKFKDLPKTSMIIQPEKDDIFDLYKRIGDTVTIAGGIKSSLLKYGTKQECIDYTKKAFDTFAPGGGFIFMQDTPLLSGNDVNIENLFAVYEFAKEYGKY